MKKKFLLIQMFLLSAITVSVIAQPMASMKVPYRQVIISEFRAGGTGAWALQDYYVELANVGDSSVNLNDFYYCSFSNLNTMKASSVVWDGEGNLLNVYYKSGVNGVNAQIFGRLPDSLLKPGETFVISNVYDATNTDGTLKHRERMVEVSDMYVHCDDIEGDSTIYKSSRPEFQKFNFDTVSVYYQMLWHNQNGITMLHHRIYDTAGEVGDLGLIDGNNIFFTST